MLTGVFDWEQAQAAFHSLDANLPPITADPARDKRNKDYASLLGNCSNLRSLRFSSQFDPRSVGLDIDYYDFQPCIVLTELEVQAIGRLVNLTTLSVAMPRTFLAFSSLQHLHNLNTLELRFDRWEKDLPSSAVMATWFRCLSSLPLLHTLIFIFRDTRCTASPCMLIDVVPWLRGLRTLSRVELDARPHDWYGGDSYYRADDRYVGNVEQCEPVAGAFASLNNVKSITARDKVYDVSDNGVREAMQEQFSEWWQQNEQQVMRQRHRAQLRRSE